MATLRHTRYQAAVVRDGALLLVQCAFLGGPTVWILPGGGREEGEDEIACVQREVHEETSLIVEVVRVLLDTPALPPDGTYARWRTYLCSVLEGEAIAGGGEGPNAQLIGTMWLRLDDRNAWPPEIRSDPFAYPQLLAIREQIGFGADNSAEVI